MEWINIEDELPKHYQKVIVGRKGIKGVMVILTYKDDFKGKYLWGEIGEHFAEPTHWMPIPNEPE